MAVVRGETETTHQNCILQTDENGILKTKLMGGDTNGDIQSIAVTLSGEMKVVEQTPAYTKFAEFIFSDTQTTSIGGFSTNEVITQQWNNGWTLFVTTDAAVVVTVQGYSKGAFIDTAYALTFAGALSDALYVPACFKKARLKFSAVAVVTATAQGCPI